jgi:pimeloyl-ACP methyl ester carboxylesterase
MLTLLPKRITRYAAVTTVFAAVIYVACGWYFSSQILIAERNTEQLEEITAASAQVGNLENVDQLWLTNSHGYKYDIWLHQPQSEPTCAIIFTHGWQSSRIKMRNFIDVFRTLPCVLISYDIRGHGTNPSPYSTGGINESVDLLQIHQTVKQQLALPNNRIGWFGVSLGAATSLQAAASASPAFIIADSPFSSWKTAIFERAVVMYGQWIYAFEPAVRLCALLRAGVDYRRADALGLAKSINSPVLLIHSRTDEQTHPDQSSNLYAELNHPDSELHLTEWGALHAKDVTANPNGYRSIIHNFLSSIGF